MPLNQRGVLSLFQRFIPISAFYPHFSVLSSFQRFILISAFYPHFSVLSPFQRFIPISAYYPHFSFRFQFQFPPFSFSVLSQPLCFWWVRYMIQLVKCSNTSFYFAAEVIQTLHLRGRMEGGLGIESPHLCILADFNFHI